MTPEIGMMCSVWDVPFRVDSVGNGWVSIRLAHLAAGTAPRPRQLHYIVQQRADGWYIPDFHSTRVEFRPADAPAGSAEPHDLEPA